MITESIAVLSYIGDAAFELIVRKHVVSAGIVRGDRLHQAATGYVRASAQAKAVKFIFDSLNEEEQHLVKRARNKKTSSKPRNADPVEYKWSTAFEALLGYYSITGQDEKLEAAARQAIAMIDSSAAGHGDGQ